MREGDFRLRGKEISRVEGLSDAVFGFAITLLVVSLDVPHTAAEVLHVMRGFFAFAITFSALFTVWRMQFNFFRRYGLEDNTTVTLTAVLLFVILFFIYPLKFVFGTIVDRAMYHAGWAPQAEKISGAGFDFVYVALALGWAAVLGVFMLLHRHAYRMREALQLTPIEIFDTRARIWRFGTSALPGILAAAMALLLVAFPGKEDVIVYPFIGVFILFAIGVRRYRNTFKRRRDAVLAEESRAVEA